MVALAVPAEDPRVDSKDSSRVALVALVALGLEDPRVDSRDSSKVANTRVAPADLVVREVSDNRVVLDNTRVDMADPVVPMEEYV